MATNNLLVNNEQKVLYEQTKKVERSPHNLSQSRKFPCHVGYIYPFFCRKTLPSDSFKIWSNILVKQLQPLLVPQMVSFTVNTAFYWVDYALAWPEFEYFLINQRGQQGLELPYISEKADTPYLSGVPDSSLYKNLRSFLGFSRNEIKDKVDALPFWSYKTIIRDYYLNIDRLSAKEYEKWFPTNPFDWKLKSGNNYYFGNINNPVFFFNVDSHNVRGDYFVNSYPTPLRGDIPVLTQDFNIQNFSADISGFKPDYNFNVLSLDNQRLLFNRPDTSFGSDAQIDAAFSDYGDSNNDFMTLQLKETAETSSISRTVNSYVDNKNTSVWSVIQNNFNSINNLLAQPVSSKGVSFSNISGLSSSLSFTSRQLRLLESLTRKREIDILMKPRLKNYLNTYFGVENYKSDSLYQPVFIGSTTQQILINDIEQTTATSDSPLGRQGATAISLGNNFVGEYYCRNYGCLIGLMYILPDFDYEPGFPREWQERVPDDFMNPEFTHLSMQPILNKELFVSNDSDWNNEVLGYMGMYDYYRSSINTVAGDLLNKSMADVQQFAQVRRFDNDNKPEITTAFLDSNTAFDGSVFSVPSLPPFIAQCVARVEAVRPLPQLAIPRG